MKSYHILRKVAAIAALMCVTSSALSQSVSFTDLNDATPGKNFDAAGTAPDPVDPNRLIIGFNSGRDPLNWSNNAFVASTAAFHRQSAMDTISLRVLAPAGYYISRVTYTQTGTGSALRTGKAAGGSTWVVDDVAHNLGLFSTNPSLSQTLDLTGQYKTMVPVSITTSLFVFATPSLGSASLSLTAASVQVELLPLP